MNEGAVQTDVQTDEKARVSELSDDEVRAEALVWTNDFRAEYELSPLKALPVGDRYLVGSCVIAEATGDVSDKSAPVPSSGRYIQGDPSVHGMLSFSRDGAVEKRPIPAVVAEFAKRFDAGRYPDLVRSTPFEILAL